MTQSPPRPPPARNVPTTVVPFSAASLPTTLRPDHPPGRRRSTPPDAARPVLPPDHSFAHLPPLLSLQYKIPPMSQNAHSSNQHPPPTLATTGPTVHLRRHGPLTVTVENLGVLKRAAFELGDLTVICGNNNTGKTYATYALFGFLAEWKNNLQIRIPLSQIRPLLNDGIARINVAAHAAKSTEVLEIGCRRYTGQLPRIFASKATNFKSSKFKLELQPEKLLHEATNKSFERNIRSKKGELFSIRKKERDPHLVVSLLADSQKIALSSRMIRDAISDAINDIVFGSFLPRPFIASAERTGAAIFQKELYFARNRLLEEMSRADKDIDPMRLFLTAYQDYPLPVNVNVNFTQRLGAVAKRDSFLSNDHHWLLDDFADIVGGRRCLNAGSLRQTGQERRVAFTRVHLARWAGNGQDTLY